MRLRRKPNRDIRLERCGHLIIKNPETLKGQWLYEFPDYNALHIELGCGRGRFTAETAKREQGVLFIALEKSADAMVIAAERADSEGIGNARYVNRLADDLAAFFVPGEAARIYINFCDPWPARRHTKRRLTERHFLSLYKQVLAPGGEIHFKTDNRPLFEFSLEEFELCGFELFDVTRDLHSGGICGVMTDYESKFYNQGIPINRCVAKLNCE